MTRGTRGFTLLEVLVAIAILGLGLTAILSAQTGLFASSSYAERISVATGLVRCKMSEIELKLAKDGYYPLVDVTDAGPCCAEEPYAGFDCKWKIEKVELPKPPTSTDLNSSLGGPGASQSGLGPLGALAAIGQSGGAVLGQNPQMGDVSKLLAGSGSGFGSGFGTDLSNNGSSISSAPPPGMGAGMGMGGTQVLAPLVMSLVYPSLKPMLEASIRKLTVSVEWKDGSKTRDLSVTQFITSPQQGGLSAQGADGMTNAIESLLGTPGSGSKASTPGQSPLGGTGFGL